MFLKTRYSEGTLIILYLEVIEKAIEANTSEVVKGLIAGEVKTGSFQLTTHFLFIGHLINCSNFQ